MNNLSIFVGAAGAAFGAAQNFAFGGDVLSVGVGDWDGDGRHDVAGANLFNNQVTTALNTSDLVPPDTTITGGPAGPTNDTTPTFTFTSSEGGPNFQCAIDNSGVFAPCSSPHTTATLVPGPHSIQVRAVDAGGNVDGTPASRSFTVDTTAPDTAISPSPPAVTSDTTPSFSFSSSEPTGATFECRVYSGPVRRHLPGARRRSRRRHWRRVPTRSR